MGAFLQFTSYMHHVFISLAFLASVAICDVCWHPSISKDPIVGFDLGLTHGASVVFFPNGTLVNVALVETNADYQAWITRNLYDVLNNQYYGLIDTDREPQERKSIDGNFMGIIRQSLAEHLRSIFGTVKSTGDVTEEIKSKTHGQRGLESLLEALKTKTEDYLGKDITSVSMTVPSFFNYKQMLVFQQALNDTSIRLQGCIENNDLAAALAQRHSQFQLQHKIPISATECIFGSFGVEEVISIGYTGNILTLSHYELYIGKQTAFAKHNKIFIALRNLTVNNSGVSVTESQCDVFWQTIQSSIRTLIIEGRHIRRRTARLILSGASSQDPDLLNNLRLTLGETIPSNTSSPRAVHIVLTQKESTHNHEEENRRSSQLSCLYSDHSSEWVLKDYEDDLLALVELSDVQNDGGVDIDPRFIAARGAALLGLASRTLTCEQRSAIAGGFWSDWNLDNRKEGKYLHFPGCDESQEEWCFHRQDTPNI